MSSQKNLNTATATVFTFILGTLVWHAVTDPAIRQEPVHREEERPCLGEPIKVDYPFQGGYIEPHACQPQCNGDTPMFVLYTNGLATQCEPPPGCNDTGEDKGITCAPGKMMSIQH